MLQLFRSRSIIKRHGQYKKFNKSIPFVILNHLFIYYHILHEYLILQISDGDKIIQHAGMLRINSFLLFWKR